jgi:hypothetical protein
MAVEAFVLPFPGRSVGVVFWEPRRAARAAPATSGRRGQPSEPDEFRVYAPGPLSPGEIAELQARYVASLGEALGQADRWAAAAAPHILWWVGGLLATALLVLRALEYGPPFLGYAWLALAAGATALPVATTAVDGPDGVPWPLRSRRVALARRLARRAGALAPVPGAEPRRQERVAGIWQVGRRLRGPEQEQLRELEHHCREHAWRQAAEFYAAQRRLRALRVPGGVRGRLLGRVPRPGGSRTAYAAMEMRVW